MINQFTLRNGVRVVCEPMESVRSVAVGVWAGAGSRNEIAESCGISHFIEHMLFKGTRRRTARQIAEAIEFVGGHINAFTAKDCTCFYTKTLDSHIGVAIDVLSDIIFHSKLNKADVDLERNVILEEINMYEDSPDELVHDLLAEGVWRDGSLGNPILGRPETLARIDKAVMKAYIAEMYVPGNIVISVAGSFDGEALRGALEKGFGGIGKGAAEKPADKKSGEAAAGEAGGTAAAGCAEGDRECGAAEKPAVNGGCEAEARDTACPGRGETFISDCFLRNKDTEQIHLCAGFKSAELGDDDLYPLHLVNYLFGGGMSSVLFQKIREELGLVYSIYSYITAYKGAGLLAIYAGMQAENAARVYEMILDELVAFKKSGVGAELLARAKEQFKGSFFMGLESPGARMSALGKSQLLLGYYNTPEEIISKIDKVSIEDVYRVTRGVFTPGRFAVSAVGRIDAGLEKALERPGDRLF